MSQKIIGASRKGASHIRTNKACQDSKDKAYRYDTYILTVADGHGSDSSPYSDEGSAAATSAFVKVMLDILKEYKDKPELLMTYLNREGDMKVAMEICREWQERIVSIHRLNKRQEPFEADGTAAENAPLWKLYGTTLLGLVVTPMFLFALQIGDGDIAFVDKNGFSYVLEGDKLLGVETHSLSRPDAWKKAISVVRTWDIAKELPSAFILTTDGFANSYRTQEAYQKTCQDYFEMLNTYGPNTIQQKLYGWLDETSEKGCGDDITMEILYNYHDDAIFKSEAENGES